MSPVFTVSVSGHTDILQLLLKHNCNTYICNDRHESALFKL